MSDIAGYKSLGSEINKSGQDGEEQLIQGVVSDKLSELTLDMKDEDLVKLTQKWKKAWDDSPKKTEWDKQGDENEEYWLGKQKDLPKEISRHPNVDNIIFEALETYLPQMTRRNPEPLVQLDYSERSPDGKEDEVKTKYVEKVKTKLADVADKRKLRLKIKKAARFWSIHLLGVLKFGWNLDEDGPSIKVIRPKKMILDPEAMVDEDGYDGIYTGEFRKLPVSKIEAIAGKELSEKAKKKLEELVKGDKDTQIQFIEWWTAEYICWILDDCVLLKRKNPHWNADQTETPQPTDMASPGVQVDNMGEVTVSPVDIPGINHFTTPRIPYAFLSIFNLADRPMDQTSIVTQNLSNQDSINELNKQIEDNVADMNGGLVVSLERSGLTQPQANKVTRALRKGGVVAIPSGAPSEAIEKFTPSGLPADVYNHLADKRSRTRDIFGIKGSSAAGLQTEQTVRGKILNKGTDTDRIGGGVAEYLEQLADVSYNWVLQLLYVYDKDFQFLAGAKPPKVNVSVKEGSLLPKDSTTIANQALELAGMNRISTLDLFKRLEYPNAEELAANVWLEQMAPHMLYQNNPLVQQVLGMQQQAAQAQMQAQGQVQQQESDREMMMEDKKHGQNMELEGVRQAGRSLLSAVKTKGAS